MSKDEIIQAALKEVLSDSGSGASVDDPRRLGRIHPLLAPSIEHALVSGIYGNKDTDWFDAGRRYHKGNSVCEQLIRVSRNPKPDWAKPDHTYSMFFEISQLTDSAPVPDEFRESAAEATLKMPVPDGSFVSRFPLTAIKAHDAKEAARIIAGYLAQAQAGGWRVDSARALVEEWRNEYDLMKGDDKTTFRFDMRPMLTSSSRLDLVALTLIAGTPKLEEVIKNFESMGSWPEAFARAGLSFVDTSKRKTQIDARSTAPRSTIPDILYDVTKRTICWNQDALEKLVRRRVSLVGRVSTLDMTASDLLSLLMLARSSEWRGADQLFQAVPIGFAFTLQDGQQVSDSAASALSAVLEKIEKAVPDRSNSMLKTAESLANFAATGGFAIRYQRSDSITPEQSAKQSTETSARSSTGITSEQAGVEGPPGGWARYRQYRKAFNLRDRINMLNGLYACVRSYTIALKTPDYLSAAARESVSVPANSMGFITKSKQLYLNVDQSQAISDVSYAYVRHPTVTILRGPTFADALCYGFYRLVCTFVGKDEFPTEDDVIQHAKDLQKWEWDARTRDAARHSRLVLQDIKTTLQFMKEFAEGTPLEAAVVKAQKSERKKSLPAYFIAAMIFAAMPAAAAVVYHFTSSALYATGAFFLPILIYWVWMGWLILDTQRLIEDSKRKFPDSER
jgi:hypothetical protein